MRWSRRSAIFAVVAATVAVSSLIFIASPAPDMTRDPQRDLSFGDIEAHATGSTRQLPDWLDTRLCTETCDELLTAGTMLDLLADLEGSTDPPPGHGERLTGLTYSFCSTSCPDRFLTRTQVELVLWRWLGSPGWPLIGSGRIASDTAMAAAFFNHRAPAAALLCETTCEAREADLRRALDALARRGQLDGLAPRTAAPSDLIGVAPFWAAAEWYPDDELCTDSAGSSRYGFYDGRICVSPELEAALRRDVARHELAHFWQHWHDNGPDAGSWEPDADCWAALHGASWFNYVPAGCRDRAHREALIDEYAASLGLGG